MCGDESAYGGSRWKSKVDMVVCVVVDWLGFEFLGMQICDANRVLYMFTCVCNRVGLDKFFDLDLIGVGFRWNGL